jgi:hypothetical protein
MRCPAHWSLLVFQDVIHSCSPSDAFIKFIILILCLLVTPSLLSQCFFGQQPVVPFGSLSVTMSLHAHASENIYDDSSDICHSQAVLFCSLTFDDFCEEPNDSGAIEHNEQLCNHELPQRERE